MPALNFTKFVDAVENGLASLNREPFPHPGVIVKRQTVRKLRKDKRDPVAGQKLVFFTGQRTKKCRRLGEAICKSSVFITIEPDGWVSVGNLPLPGPDYDTLAQADGFRDFESFFSFFQKTHGLPFEGKVICW
jgi:hypothetical protein